eukprot:CAMPEP_0196590200 /NCGR_PEP_ID=MMETSP1081-20130531/65934_1 /TAXON_ID=36882 /ORGANISM="Pyramimonas amylifera, Strain CCMP720" /LENGTH=160 /DNA_ID=CAMNT_0041913237 /DNA_START=147 /DNA_END=629 /DNA_ORIENTATION=+
MNDVSKSMCKPFAYFAQGRSLIMERKTLPQMSRYRRMNVKAMGIKIVEQFDSSFELQPEAEEALVGFLKQEDFTTEVADQAQWSSEIVVEFTGLIFQPVPWTPSETRGMPKEFEKYLNNKDNYAIINVPPTFMFKAKIFKPSRLCAIFKKSGAAEPVLEE